MNVKLADSHAHLDEPQMASMKDEVLNRARQAGVHLVINVGIGLANSRQVVDSAQRFPQVFATVGVHPHGAQALRPETIDALTPLVRHPKVVAVGEIGLDFYRRRSPEAVQEFWFRELLEWACGLNRVVVVHTREATAATLKILREFRGRLPGGVMHCFAGSYEEARDFLDLGLYLSFSGVLTYPPAEPLRRVAARLPLDRLLVETDCPYLAPQPWRGKRNEPAYLPATAATLARLHDLPLSRLAERTWNNTVTLFGLNGRLPPESEK
ncbi:MAG: TatD family deoxyribonuclease [Deltaproteobacteria bacterium]|nr:TatD family deoxyribonuclease [Deltaproteobacteria bacterium]